jgi:hypothetical protein
VAVTVTATQVELRVAHDGTFLSLPLGDVLLLPLTNSTVEELAVLVLAAVKAHGYVDELHTLEELSGELGRGEAFYRLEDDIMVRVCALLKAQGHATIVYAPAFGVIFKSDKMSM